MSVLARPAGPRRRGVVVCVALLAAAAPARAAENPERSGQRVELRGEQWGLPKSVRIAFGEFVEQETEVRFFGYVVVDAGDTRIQADSVVYRKTEGTFEATGDVVLSFPGAVLAGSHLLYRVESQTGSIDDVVGYLDQDNAVLRAERVERLGPHTLSLERGVFTTCTQPTPAWSFHVKRGVFDLGRYAYLHGIGFWIHPGLGPVPVFGSPYLIWPIKTGRATGLLFPEFRTSTKLGTSASLPFYWPFANSADLTLKLTGYTKVGAGVEAILDWLPSWQGSATGDARYINDRVRGKNRYLVTWNQTEVLHEDYQLTASVEQVSDFDYFTDYETDLYRAAAPQTASTVDLTRNWSWYSLSLRARRYVQYFVAGTSALSGKEINSVLPQIEWRGRSQRLGKSPLYLSFESSLAGFSREILGPPADEAVVVSENELVTAHRARWGRVDAAPQLQLPVLKAAWADMTLNGGWRGTWWSAQRDPGQPQEVVPTSLTRSLWNAGFTFSGPRFQRVFLTPHWSYSPKLKHVIEPFVNYSWRPNSGADAATIPVFDQIDAVPGQTSSVTYGVRQRFLGLRRPDSGPTRGLTSAAETSFAGLEQQSKKEAQREQKANGPAGEQAGVQDKIETQDQLGPVEFASFDISQDYSFVQSLTTVYGGVATSPDNLQTTSVVTGFRNYSPVRFQFRLNPTSEKVLAVGWSFDPANNVLTEASISTTLRLSERSYVSGTWYRRGPPDPLLAASSFVRGRWGVLSPGRRFSLETDLDWNAQEHKLEHQGYQVRWATQCCAFRFGVDARSFTDNVQREFSLVVDLSGIGEVLKLQQTSTR